MTIARSIRLLLAFISGCIIIWSFVDVASRTFARNSSSNGPANTGPQITLTLLHWGDKAEDVIVSDLIAEYEKNHPGVHILRVNPGYDQFRPKLKTMMSAGTPPDIFYLPPDILPEMASLKLLRPIDDYVAQERASGQGAYLDEFWPILMKAWHFDVKTGQIGTGQLYG